MGSPPRNGRCRTTRARGSPPPACRQNRYCRRPGSRQPIPVIPAPRVLGQVAADRSGITDLRARYPPRRIGQHAVFCADYRAALDLSQTRQRPDLDPIRGLTYPFQGRDPANVDDRLRTFDALLEPREAVIAAGHLPPVLAVAIEQGERIVELRRLIELETGHHVFDDHVDAPSDRVDLKRLVRLR